jgi:hypothetical protein
MNDRIALNRCQGHTGGAAMGAAFFTNKLPPFDKPVIDIINLDQYR